MRVHLEREDRGEKKDANCIAELRRFHHLSLFAVQYRNGNKRWYNIIFLYNYYIIMFMRQFASNTLFK